MWAKFVQFFSGQKGSLPPRLESQTDLPETGGNRRLTGPSTKHISRILRQPQPHILARYPTGRAERSSAPRINRIPTPPAKPGPSKQWGQPLPNIYSPADTARAPIVG